MSKLDAVFELVKQQPVLPIEVASKLGMDSFLAKAYLDQLVETGQIKATSEKVGGVSVYFTPNQEIIADTKVKKLLGIKPTAKNFAVAVPQSAEIEKKRAEFMIRLKDIEEKEKQLAERKAKLQVVKPKKAKVEHTPEIKIIEEPKPEIKEAPKVEIVEVKPVLEVKEEEKPKPSLLEEAKRFIIGEPSTIVEASLAWLAEKGAEIISKEMKKRGKEAVIAASIPSSIGPMPFLVFVLNKKSITEADLSIAYSEGVQKKFPVIIASKGKLTKTAKTYLSTISGVVKYKLLE
jgi:hypothetical protein